MFSFSQSSIQRRLRYAMMTTAEIGLLVTLLFYSLNDYFRSKDGLVDHLKNIAAVMQLPASQALLNNDYASAKKVLENLKAVTAVQNAYIINRAGTVIARYSQNNREINKNIHLTDRTTFSFTSDWLELSTPLLSPQGTLLGTIMLNNDLSPLNQQVKLNILAALLITVLAIIFSYIVAFWLQRKITKPIIQLANHMKKVAVSKIYTNLLEQKSNDEIGDLYEQFNNMLEQINSREQELSTHKKELEETVKLRTEALNTANKNLKQSIAEANKAKELALDAVKAKSAFLANMSHEIRTPMNGVLGMLEMMKDTQLDSTQKDYLETAYGSADSLLQIINDILDFSKIEAGKLSLETVDINPYAITEDIATLLASKAREKGVELSCYTDTTLPKNIKGDPVRIRQILTNLLGNALKFTLEGQVVIRALRKDDNISKEKRKSHCCIRFEVEDTGIGIAADVIPTLFQPFTQADTSTTRKFGGTGLGLTISRQLVHLMNSELKVTSEQGKGSCFYFDLEVEYSDIVLDKKQKILDETPLKGLNVLIVDDNEINRNILRHYVQSWQMSYSEAEDGEIAFKKLQKAQKENRPFHLVYLDMQMPKLDGIELANKIFSDETLNQTKLIMLTSSGPMTKKEQETGHLHAALAKPYRCTQLLEVTLNVMTASETKQVKTTSVQQEENGISLPQTVSLLLVEDNKVNQKVANAMLGKLGLCADIANNGLEALEAIENKAYDLVFMDCQMPKMSGYEATEKLRELEKSSKSKHLTIIAMTANAMEGDREKCLESGMDDYISKPIKLEILKGILTKWLTSK